MHLRDHRILNGMRRLRGWRPGRARFMVEARDDRGHFFCVYECRGRNDAEARARLQAQMDDEDVTLIEIAETLKASVPAPSKAAVIRLSDRVYFGGDSTGQG